MVVVNKSQIHQSTADSDLLCTFSAEASDLQLSPGEWPDFITIVDNTEGRVAHGFLFQRTTQLRYNGEFGGYNYTTRDGRLSLVVFND